MTADIAVASNVGEGDAVIVALGDGNGEDDGIGEAVGGSRDGVDVGIGVLVLVAVKVGIGEAVLVDEGVMVGGSCVAVDVFVGMGARVAPASSVAVGVFVEGAVVGVAGPTATRLALSQYISLCLLAKSGFVRIKTVRTSFWATASMLICPHWSITLDMEASPDQIISAEAGSQFPVGSMPTRKCGFAGKTDEFGLSSMDDHT